MRIKGRLEKWNDERGFGFLKPLQELPSVFVHISDFRVRMDRPQIGQIYVFEVVKAPDGKTRAINVHAVVGRPPRSVTSRPAWGAATFLTVPAFVALYLIVGMIWRVPMWVGGMYIALSGVTFIGYSIDKAAAAAGSWRISEKTLLLLGLMGGWPGAIFAQQILRHKSKKPEFRASFWASVLFNAIVFVLCFTPLVAHVRR